MVAPRPLLRGRAVQSSLSKGEADEESLEEARAVQGDPPQSWRSRDEQGGGERVERLGFRLRRSLRELSDTLYRLTTSGGAAGRPSPLTPSMIPPLERIPVADPPRDEAPLRGGLQQRLVDFGRDLEVVVDGAAAELHLQHRRFRVVPHRGDRRRGDGLPPHAAVPSRENAEGFRVPGSRNPCKRDTARGQQKRRAGARLSRNRC